MASRHCGPSPQGVKTEEAIYSMALRLKKIDPKKKIFFYFATDQQGINCYAAGKDYLVSVHVRACVRAYVCVRVRVCALFARLRWS